MGRVYVKDQVQPTRASCLPGSIMASTSVRAMTQQLAGLEISKKQPTSTSSRPINTKHPTRAMTQQLASLEISKKQPTSTSSRPIHTKQPAIDIGKYDGGFEIDNAKRGEKVYGEAAEDLALDSSVSRYASPSSVRKYLQPVIYSLQHTSDP